MFKLKSNPVLNGILLPGAITTARYSTYADNIMVFVTNTAMFDEVSTEIREYEMVQDTSVPSIMNVEMHFIQMTDGLFDIQL